MPAGGGKETIYIFPPPVRDAALLCRVRDEGVITTLRHARHPMPRSLSSAWTFFYKFPLPVILTGASAAGLRRALEERGVYSGTSGAAPPIDLILIGAMAILAIAVTIAFCAPLKRVRVSDDGESLMVSNYLQEWKVPVALISEVTQNRWLKLRPITIHLRIDPGCGRRLMFMPPLRINFLFWREDPEVEELRALASAHQVV